MPDASAGRAAHPEVHVQIAGGDLRVLQEGVVNANEVVHRAAYCGEGPKSLQAV